MKSETVIAIAGIATAGVIGPAVAAYFVTRQVRRQHGHDREIADLGELRKVLDDIAQPLSRAENGLVNSGVLGLQFQEERERGLQPSEADYADFGRYSTEYHEQLRVLNAARERVLIRLGEAHPVSEKLTHVVEILTGGGELIGLNPPGQEAIKEFWISFGAARREYGREAQRLVGSRLPK